MVDKEAKANLNRSISIHLFNTLFEVEWFKCRSSSWYTKKQIIIMKDLIQRFSDQHSQIRRY